MAGNGSGKPSRSYRPVVEALEALRLLSGDARVLPGLVVERGFLEEAPAAPIAEAGPTDAGADAWDAVLDQSRVVDLLPAVPTSAEPRVADPSAIRAGFAQLDRYLGRAWYRAGIAPQQHDDCSQAVYVTLLENLGRLRFDSLAAEIGRFGIKDVLSRETAEGPDFFRAIDAVKKRAQREKTFVPLDGLEVIGGDGGAEGLAHWRGALEEAIEQTLSPREADLVHETLRGKTPSEIAESWGVAPKTVSNEKTRVLQKLREALVDDLLN